MKDERIETSKRHMKVQYMKSTRLKYEKYKNVDKSIGQYKIGYVKMYEIWKYRK